ncbi:GNAT family N-acetyltransferase [Ferrimonas pelagia]|uniref:N-acetyltransferase domain-containing protein n=1 Tax=Ferrimonas pelagia TaxID=1177826 RepID=A0ABP9F4N6_9GAMM
MQFQLAQAQDQAAIAQLHTQSWQENYRAILAQDYLQHRLAQEHQTLWSQRLACDDPSLLILIAMAEGKLAGFICVQAGQDPKLGHYVENLHIHPDFRRQGLGKALLQQAQCWLNDQDPAQGLYLHVLAGNPKAIAFYARLGAYQVENAIWDAPCGTQVPEFIYRWHAGTQI